MKLILTQEVTGLGGPGDVVEVADGYGRNYLAAARLGDLATKGAEKQVGRSSGPAPPARSGLARGGDRRGRAARRPDGQLPARAGEGGRLFGSVTTADVADAVTAAGGPTLDRRRVELPGRIKSTAPTPSRCRCTPRSPPR